MPPVALAEASPATSNVQLRGQRALLSPERVRELSRLRPARAAADTLACWLAILAAWFVVAKWPTWWVVLLAIPVIGTRYYALLIVGHDAIHRRLFQSARWNDWFADLFIFGPVGAITRINNRNHLGHHHFLSTPDDPDLHLFTCTNKHQWHLLLGYLTGATSLWRSFKNVFLSRSSYPAPDAEKSDKVSAGYTLRDVTLIAVWQIALIGGLTWLVAWWAYPVLWLVPLYGFAFLGDNLRAFAEHSQPQSDSRANEHRLITFLSNPVERVFVAPLNMNYHAAHHLWPSIPYYNLPQADEAIRGLPAAQGLEWRGTYIGYLVHYFRQLPLEECQSPKVPTA
jgi:fatty acid desaturase